MRIILFVALLATLTACQTGTTVVIEHPAEQVAAKVREHFTATFERGKEEVGFMRLHGLKIAESAGNTRLNFLENYDKMWAIKTQITIEPRGQAATLIIIHCDQVEAGLFSTEHIRRTELEGHRMAEVLRILDVQPLKPTRWRD